MERWRRWQTLFTGREDGDVCAGVVDVVWLEAVASEVVWPLPRHLGVLQPAPDLLLLAEAGQPGQTAQPGAHWHPGAGLVQSEHLTNADLIFMKKKSPTNDFETICILISIPINDLS